jgi:hypothetical protein
MTDINHLAQLLAGSELEMTELPDGSAVLLDVAGHRVLTLSPTGNYLTSLVRSGATTLGECVDQLIATYDVERAIAEADVSAFMRELERALLPGGSPPTVIDENQGRGSA